MHWILVRLEPAGDILLLIAAVAGSTSSHPVRTRARRQGRRLEVLFLDLDGFKLDVLLVHALGQGGAREEGVELIVRLGEVLGLEVTA